MPQLIQDIWILTESGVAVYQKVFDKKLDEQLFAMLMSALNSFAEEISEGGLSNFEIKDKRFSIIKKNCFLFIATSSPKLKDKKVMVELENVSKKFFERYPEEVLCNWNNDIEFFSDFDDFFTQSTEKRVQSFFDNM
ncbi:MAG: hypothetical protein JW891_06915 [Candidatus Lokiarchaeota archaeon]|nr:hypothetical protein [Candidatus Lokiarchaeota archaeon]